MAHIVAHSDEGPRGDPSYPQNLRDSAENLILLCPTHHAIVDAQDSSYTIDTLRKWKEDAERFVTEALTGRVVNIGFEELARVTRVLLASAVTPAEAIQLPLKPREKLALNGLSGRTEQQLNIGYLRVHDVEAFVAQTETLESEYGERLAAGFRSEYRRLMDDDDLTGDALFFALAEWSAQGDHSLDGRAAGVAVLTHLFHVCEVFDS